jgi:hypothetical protein
MSFLDSEANRKLSSLLEMSHEQFEGISARLNELGMEAIVLNSENFKIGFTFGKIENKFTSWFYSKHGRSMTDNEYREFWKILSDYLMNF